MLPQPGTYKAKTANGVVYETEGGALMVAFDFGIDAEHSIIGRVCLASKAGEPQPNNLRNLREAFGWDGADPFWLADTDLSDRDVEIVVEMENDQNGNPRPTVRWINAPGRGGGLGSIKPADRKAVLAKYGMKFRALAGGTAVKPAATAPAAPAPAPKPAPVAPAPKAAPGVAVTPATLQEAWEEFCKHANPALDESGLNNLWWQCVVALIGEKPQEQATPEDWGIIKASAATWLSKQMAY